MASNYNTRPKAPEIIIDDGGSKLIRKKDMLSQLMENELLNE